MQKSSDEDEPWRDTTRPPAERVADLVTRMTLPEKVAQLYGVWVGMDTSGGEVSPHQHDFAEAPPEFEQLIENGLGQLTRPFGTAPVEPSAGARTLADTQRRIMSAGRFGLPATVHEECLTGLATWQATVFPSPLCWAASFDPALVERMAYRVGAQMRRLGVHQGLAPVLDVVRDLRWGRVEETMGEDPLLVGIVGSAYVRGLESAGVVSTLKHFVGYSASRAGRNLAPVSIGGRELSDVLLPPFEMALRAGARSVMNAYTDVDGVPVAADPAVLGSLLREDLGFEGTVVADYFSVAFLQTLHGVAGSPAEAAAQALCAGVDVELPTVSCFGAPLLAAVRDGSVDERLVDRALERVLLQKCELGLLDPTWDPEPAVAGDDATALDDDESRSVARELARRSVVLLANDGTLPLRPGQRVALVGPRADDPGAMLGCYSFPMHVGVHHPDVPLGVSIPTLAEGLADDPAGYRLTVEQGCPVLGGDDRGIARAAEAARSADVCVAVLGDRAGLFGGGTSGEGCDAADLRLPGRQEDLLEALLATGTPVVLVLLVGRPYELSRQVDRLGAVVCGFFPGEEGATALADVLGGRVNPSGRLPVGFPGAANQPATYLSAPLGRRSDVSVIDPTPLFPFGHGLTYAPLTWTAVELLSGEEWPTDGACELAVSLSNDSRLAGSEVVQVYLRDPVAEVTRPAQQLVAVRRVDLEPGGRARVVLRLHADLTSFTGRAGVRVVEPGEVELRVGASSVDIRRTLLMQMTGERRDPGRDRHLEPETVVEPSTATMVP